jgi:acylphosphatase
MKTHKIILKGRVQGVGFRYFISQQADQYEIKGWARNNPDGTVEVWAQGSDEKMGKFIDKIKQGPSMCDVTDSEIETFDHEEFHQFRIRG